MMTSAPPSLIFRVAWRNVRRNWRHSLAALGTMAVGFVALAIFQGYIDEFMTTQVDLIYARNMLGEIMVRRPGAGTSESRADPERFLVDEKEQAFVEAWIKEHADDVKTRLRTLAIRGMATTGKGAANFVAFGYDVPEGEIARRHWAWNAWAGHPLKAGEPNTALIGIAFGAILGCEPDQGTDIPMDPVTAAPVPVERPFTCRQTRLQLSTTSASGRMNAMDAEIVGLTRGNIREIDERLVWIPLQFARDLAETNALSSYMIVLNEPDRAEELRADMRAAAERAGIKLEIIAWEESETADTFNRAMDLLGVFRTLMFIVILIISGVAVLTTMMKTVRERTREVGTLRSIGYRGGDLLAMFAVESVLLSLHAAVVGLLAAMGVTALINSAHITYKAGILAESIPFRIAYTPSTYAAAAGFLALVAIIAAVAAARHVTRLNIATALSDS